jgi:CubicO group peptidase (beta-lactamase class C family)
MSSTLKKSVLSLAGLLAVGTALTFTPPFVHIRHFVERGNVDIHDFDKHPTRQVLASTRPEPWELDSSFNKLTVPQNLIDTMEKYETTAFLVFQHGKLKYERYWEGQNAKSLSQSFSAVKSLVSMLVGIALDEGKIKSLDEPVANFIESFKEGEKSKITLRHCLMMSSGLNWNEKDKGVFSNNAKGYYGENIPDVIDHLVLDKPIGKEFEYRSGDTQVLGLVLEKVYRKNLSDLLSEKIFQKIGAETNAKWMLDVENGHEKAYCCFAPTAHDYARFGHLMLWKGNWKGRQVVPQAYMEAALSPATQIIDPKSNQPMQFYGYQFWLQPYKGMQTQSMRGLLGQLIWAIPAKDAVIVRLGHKEAGSKSTNTYYRTDSENYLEAGLSVLR